MRFGDGKGNLLRLGKAVRTESHGNSRRRCFRAIASVQLLVSLLLSAWLLASVLESGFAFWLGTLAMLPLLRSIQTLSPVDAARAGGFWGALLYLFCSGPTHATIAAGFLPLLLLIFVPAMYCGLGAWATRRSAFNPIMLALGWTLVELCLRPLSLRYGLLISGGDSITGGIVGRLFGYVVVSVLVVFSSASLLLVLDRLRLKLWKPAITITFDDTGLFVQPLVSLYAPSLEFNPSRPRAPPLA